MAWPWKTDINENVQSHAGWKGDKIQCKIFANFSEYFIEFYARRVIKH